MITEGNAASLTTELRAYTSTHGIEDSAYKASTDPVENGFMSVQAHSNFITESTNPDGSRNITRYFADAISMGSNSYGSQHVSFRTDRAWATTFEPAYATAWGNTTWYDTWQINGLPENNFDNFIQLSGHFDVTGTCGGFNYYNPSEYSSNATFSLDFGRIDGGTQTVAFNSNYVCNGETSQAGRTLIQSNPWTATVQVTNGNFSVISQLGGGVKGNGSRIVADVKLDSITLPDGATLIKESQSKIFNATAPVPVPAAAWLLGSGLLGLLGFAHKRKTA